MRAMILVAIFSVATYGVVLAQPVEHLIEGSATVPVFWQYKTSKSQNSGTPVVVDDLQVGDVILVSVPGRIPHGFGPLVDGKQSNTPVFTCGDTRNVSDPGIVLRELDCPPDNKSSVGVNLPTNGGKVRMEVLPSFSADLSFWCTVHTKGMKGMLKLKKL